MPLVKQLIPKNNSAASYFPASTNNANNTYEWEAVVGFFIKSLHNIELLKKVEVEGSTYEVKTLQNFKELCKQQLIQRLDGEPIWHIIEKVYFDNEQVLNISPEMQSLRMLNTQVSNAADERLTLFLSNAFGQLQILEPPSPQLNFLEREIKEVFSLLIDKSEKKLKLNKPYLPELSMLFQKDLEFLVGYPEHFLQNIKPFLKLYGFLYTAQLALNVRGWSRQPEVKPCYFILDSEKASKERTKLQLHGHKQVIESSYALFPHLALNESLQDAKSSIVPLWELVGELTSNDIDALNNYAADFHEDRKLTSELLPAENIEQAITSLIKLFEEQFNKGTTREGAFNNFVKATRETLIKPFEQSRGRAGSYLVLNQDYLLLLTNISIGSREKLRLHELLVEFQNRGVFFDKSSEECLIDLFERMGNVERMSDSGDAVYVKKTI